MFVCVILYGLYDFPLIFELIKLCLWSIPSFHRVLKEVVVELFPKENDLADLNWKSFLFFPLWYRHLGWFSLRNPIQSRFALSVYTLLYLKGENSLFSTHVVWNKIVLEFSRGWCCAIVSLWILILPPCRDLLAILNPVCRPHGNSANAHANSLVSNLLYFVLADMITTGFWIAANREAPGYLKQNVYWAKASLVL